VCAQQVGIVQLIDPFMTEQPARLAENINPIPTRRNIPLFHRI
jgi:hypothetical protein